MIIALAMLVLYIVYRATFYNNQKDSTPYDYVVNPQIEAVKASLDDAITSVLNEKAELVSISSHDRIRLNGKYYHHLDTAPVAILFHGYRGDGIRDFAGAFGMLKRLGYNILLVEQRGHGLSQSHTTTFGIKEHRDCLCWIDYVSKRFSKPSILLMGVSMGGATVLMASAAALPQNVKCIVADCPYDTPANIIKRVIKTELRLSEKLLFPIVKLASRVFCDCDLDSNSPLKAIAKAQVPVLLIHGDLDLFVPCEMSKNLHNTAPEKTELCIINGTGHALNQIAASIEYEKALRAFVQKHIE